MDPIVTITLNAAIDRIVEVEGFRVGGHLPGKLLARVPAGKGVNVSRTLARLNVPNIATGFVGRGQIEEYERSFEDTCTEPQFLALEGTTRENLTILDPVSHVETHIRDHGISPTDTDLNRMRNKLNLLIKGGGSALFSGSLPPGMTTKAAAELVELACAGGARVAVDGPGTLLQALRKHKLWLIKPNSDELAEMLEVPRLGDEGIVGAGRELSKKIEIVIVTCGAAGGYLFVDGSAMIGKVNIGEARVRSSVGCGDCMLGAFVAGRRRGEDIRSAYRYSLAVAAAAALEPAPGFFDKLVVTKMLQRARVEPLA